MTVIDRIDEHLILRTADPADVDQLVDFHEEVFMDEPSGTRAWWIAEWGRDLLTKPHPTFTPSEDGLVVEDARSGEIVSSCLYFTQQWQCQGVRFDIGRPEIVGTRQPYRDRGLIRRQFDVMHRWASERNHDITVIDGIPAYYTQFGYTQALNYSGDRNVPIAAFPQWGEVDTRGFTVRDATPDDIEFIVELLAASTEHSLYSPVYKVEELRYMTFDRNARSATAWRTAILVENASSREPKRVGAMMYVMVPALDLGIILRIEMSEARYWRLATIPLLKEFRRLADVVSDRESDPGRAIKSVRVELQPNHPAFVFDNHALGPEPPSQYAWYVRVPDLASFVGKLAPAIDQRVASSLHAGFDGDVTIGVGNAALQLHFDAGRLTSTENLGRTSRHERIAYFGHASFMQILFGRRAIADIVRTNAEAYTGSNADAHFLQTIFPHQLSDLSLTLL